MIRTARLAVALVTLVALAGCAPATEPAPEPDEPVAEDGTDENASCYEGEWQLDVPDYAAQSEAYVLGLGLPIEGFAMTGAGTIAFTPDGLVATQIDLTTTGTIVAGDTMVPLNTRSAYAGSGDWNATSDPTVIDLQNWSNVRDADVVVDPAAPDLPAIDYTDIPSVTAECSADTLLLQAPGAPLAALWHR